MHADFADLKFYLRDLRETGWHVILTVISVGLRGVVSEVGMDSPGAGLRKTSKLDLDNTSERTEIDIKEAALIYWGSFFSFSKIKRRDSDAIFATKGA